MLFIPHPRTRLPASVTLIPAETQRTAPPSKSLVTPLPPGPLAGERIVAVDAIRGFALLGIVLVHMVEQYVGSPPPPSTPDLGVYSVADQVTRGVVGLLFVGKFFAIFSLLFGLSFFIQMDRAARTGRAFAARFAWRLGILFAIGMAHHLLYRGDILAVYAALGLLLLPLYRAGDRVLLGLALTLALGGHRLMLAAYGVIAGQPVAIMPVEPAAIDAWFETVRSGSPLSVAVLNIREGLATKLHFQFGWFGRGWQTLALFVVGLYIGRHRFHETLAELRRPLRRLVVGGLGLALGSAGVLAGAAAAGLGPQSAEAARPWHFIVGLGLYDLFNLGLTSALLGGFVLLYHGARAGGVLRRLAPVGRTALTVYVAQSVVGTAIFYGWGLGLLGRMPLSMAFGLGLVLFAGQGIAAALWLRHFRFGPLEWLWRSATYGRVQPLRASPSRKLAPAG
jgi:uncharacterized protein